MLYLHAKGIKK